MKLGTLLFVKKYLVLQTAKSVWSCENGEMIWSVYKIFSWKLTFKYSAADRLNSSISIVGKPMEMVFCGVLWILLYLLGSGYFQYQNFSLGYLCHCTISESLPCGSKFMW